LRQISTLSWAERFVTLDGKRFSRKHRPQIIEIAETVDRRMGCTFLLRFPPQVFKSLFMQLRLLRTIAVSPSRSLWYCKTHKDAENFSDEKLRGLVDSILPIKSKLPFDVDARGTKTLFRFVDAPVSLLSADVRAHRNQRSAQDIYMDETWEYEPGAIAEIVARSADYEKTRRIIMCETGPSVDSESDRVWKRSSKREWHVVCTLCNKPIQLLRCDIPSEFGFKWDAVSAKDGLWDEVASSKTVRYKCQECSGEIPWTPTVLQKLNDPERGARYIGTNGDPDPQVEGWHASAFCFRDWPALIQKWLTAQNASKLSDLSLIEEFVRKDLAEVWDAGFYLKDTSDRPVGDYTMQEEWADETTLFGSKIKARFIWVDVQRECFWAVCRKWSRDGRSRLHDFAQIFGEHGVKEFADKCGVPARYVWVDNAYDPGRTSSLWGSTTKMCAQYGFWTANAVGSKDFLHKDGVRRMYSEPRPVDAWQGESGMGKKPQIALVNYSAKGAKMMLHYMRQQKHQETGEWLWSVTKDAPPEYMKQAWAEVLREKRLPTGGVALEWYRTIKDNHAFDMESGHMVTGLIAKLIGLAAEKASKEIEEPEKPVEIPPQN